MLYTTQLILETALSDDDYNHLLSDGDIFDIAVAEEINQRAVAVLHSELGGVFTIPFAPTDETAELDETEGYKVIQQLIHELMVIEAWKRRGASDLPQDIFELHKAVLDRLKRIRTGESVLLGVQTALVQDPFDDSGGGNILMSPPDGYFDDLIL